ncbi:RrF2 family transcriptional regulator [Hydrogenovibrio kuenenii]|uniref:RrF2 family transcriptional regulator n=1 Tax=Hydrogenovibrio kuenenii TaxID=63658 RepID=UPI0004652B5A|nr:Rrf2 family transcriptional regulator [Hydrogenovibrio kuenenii]
MQLTKQTDYAFRVLIYLGSQNDEKLATIQAISETFDISKSHLMKVVQKLVNHGFIQSVRGPTGGIKLGKNKNEINLRQVIELMEVTLKPVNCDVPVCRINQSCELRKFLDQAQSKYLEYAEQFTLADLVTNPVQKDIFFKAK